MVRTPELLKIKMNNIKFTEEERRKFYEQTNDFLSDRNWIRQNNENKIVYLKSGFVYPPISFLDKPRKKNQISIEDIVDCMKNFFSDRSYDYRIEDNIAIVGIPDDSFLISAGVQCFRDCFWGDGSLEKGKFFSPQPVVRTQYITNIGNGSTSSFVNPTTIQIPGSLIDHLKSLDDWFDLFSHLGLYVGDFNLEFVPKERYARGKKGNWGKTDGFSIRINYLNLNIGDAGYIKIPSNKNGIFEVSDIGFGLERILWALNKTPSYFDLIAPQKEREYSRLQLVDSIRSATLLGMSNIDTATQDAYNQFKKFTKIASRDYGLFDTFKLVEYYYNFWSRFITPRKDLLSTYYFLDEEISKESVNG